MPSPKLRGADILEDADKIPFWTPPLVVAAGADTSVQWYQPFDGWIMAFRGKVTTTFNNVTSVFDLGIVGTTQRNFAAYAGTPVALEDTVAPFHFNFDISAVASRQVFAGDSMIFTHNGGTPAAGAGVFALLIGHLADLDDVT